MTDKIIIMNNKDYDLIDTPFITKNISNHKHFMRFSTAAYHYNSLQELLNKEVTIGVYSNYACSGIVEEVSYNPYLEWEPTRVCVTVKLNESI